MEIDAFKKDGRFDQQTFERYARMQGLYTRRVSRNGFVRPS